MRKDEFLRLLRQALTGNVPAAVLEENVRYYDFYIREEVEKGRTEEEVIAEIGDPRLIARTIADTTDGASEEPFDETHNEFDETWSNYEGNFHRSFQRDRKAYESGDPEAPNPWVKKAVTIVAVVVILYLIFVIIGGLFALLSPILLPLLVIWLIIWIVRNLQNR